MAVFDVSPAGTSTAAADRAGAHAAPVIRVVVVDDHAGLRRGLVELLRSDPDLRVVGQAPGGAEGIAVTLATCPDVVLMDLQMPGMDGVEALRRLAESSYSGTALLVTASNEPKRIQAGLDAGAIGHVPKDAAGHELLAAVHAAALGRNGQVRP